MKRPIKLGSNTIDSIIAGVGMVLLLGMLILVWKVVSFEAATLIGLAAIMSKQIEVAIKNNKHNAIKYEKRRYNRNARKR